MINLDKFEQVLQNRRVLIGASGGPDSMCLLYLLNSLKDKLDIKLSVCHVNYGLREPDSDEDEQFIRKECKKLRIRFYILNYKDNILKADNNEDDLRNTRYDFFKKIKEEIKADYIAIAHNKDDQAETIIMKFLRGASLKGLSGMEYLSNSIIRPLLDYSRLEILEYLKANKIKYRIDKTNFGFDFLRNKIRNNLIPLLEREYNPNLKETLLRNSKIIRNINGFFEDYSNLIFQNISKIKIKNSQIEISYYKWNILPEALKYEIIKIAAKKLAGDLKDLQFSHLDEVVRMLVNKIPFGEKKLTGRLSIKEKYGTIIVSRI